MFRKTALTTAWLALFTVAISACDVMPSLAPLPTPTYIPTPTPSPEPTTAPTAQALPRTPSGVKPGSGLEGALRAAGMSGGIVSANKDGTLSLKTGRNSEQVQTTSGTIVVIPGKLDAQVSDIRVGDRVIADFPNDVPNAPAAMLLDFPSGYSRENLLVAAVQSNRGGSIALRTPQGPRTLTTDAATQVVSIVGDRPKLGALSDLKPAMALLVIGEAHADAFNAQVVIVLAKDARNLLGKGRQNQPVPTPTPGA